MRVLSNQISKKKLCLLVLVLAVFQMFFMQVNLSASEEAQETDQAFPRMSRTDAGYLYQMLELIDFLFTKHGIPYWIDSGTLLGSARHGGIIPWDKDADVVFLIEDEPRIFALREEFDKHGFLYGKEAFFV